jgi:hypothetical protein
MKTGNITEPDRQKEPFKIRNAINKIKKKGQNNAEESECSHTHSLSLSFSLEAL